MEKRVVGEKRFVVVVVAVVVSVDFVAVAGTVACGVVWRKSSVVNYVEIVVVVVDSCCAVCGGKQIGV